MMTPDEVAAAWNARHPRQPLTARQVSGIEAAAIQKLRVALICTGEDIQGVSELFRVKRLRKFARCARAMRRLEGGQ